MAATPFPKDFLWGSATSAYQVEGAAKEGGKGPSQQDVLSEESPFCTTDVASDHYHHLEEDVRLLKTLGLRAYRFSISWPRIFPEGIGDPNPEGVAFYHRLIDALCDAGIEPVVTMYHYDMPYSLVERYGGWLGRQSVDDFAAYARFIVKEYGGQVKRWITINEQNIIFRMWTRKNYIPEGRRTERERYQMNHHYTMAHVAAVEAVHELCKDGMASGVLAIEPTYSATSSPADNMAAARANVMRNYFFCDPYMQGRYPEEVLSYLDENGLMFSMEPGDEARMRSARSDYLAINYYRSVCARAAGEGASRTEQELNLYGQKGAQKIFETVPGRYALCENPLLDTTDWDWPIDPQGFTYAILDLWQRYHAPLLIAENGLGARDELTSDGKVHDTYRIEFLRAHIKALGDAISMGADVMGYCCWSALDLMSTSNGYAKRYGLIYVDRTDKDLRSLGRVPKDSYYWYQHVISTNGAEL